MAQVPYTYGVPTVSPAGAPANDYQHVESSPADFGGIQAQALQRAGAGLEQTSDNLARTAITIQDRWNQVAVDDYTNKFETQANNLTWGDSATGTKGLYALKGSDALNAGPGIANSLINLRDEMRGQLQNDAQRIAFDQQTRRILEYKQGEISRHLDAQADAFALDVNKDKLAGAAQTASLGYNSDQLIEQQIDSGRQGAIRSAQVLHGTTLGPDITLKAISDADTIVVRGAVMGALSQNDAGRAQQILDKYGDRVEPAVRESLHNVVTSKSNAEVGGAAGSAAFNQALAGGGAGGQAPTFSAEAIQRANLVKAGLIKRGMDEDTATAFAANSLHESEANPHEPPGDMGASHGLFMWRDSRAQQFQQRNGGKLPEQAPLDAQLDHVMYEVNGPENAAYQKIQQAQGPAAKAAAVSAFYLRPKDTVPEMNRRSATAAMLSGKASDIPPQSQPDPTDASYVATQQANVAAAQSDAYRRVMSDPNLTDEQKQHAFQRVNQQANATLIALDAKQKARVTQDEVAADSWVQKINAGATPDMIQQINNDPRISSWRTRQSLMDLATKNAGVENTASYGTGYSDVYKRIVAPEGDPNKITSANDILTRGGPDGDLTLPGVQKLLSVFNASKKDIDQAGVHTTVSSLLTYAKNQLSFEQDLGPIKIRDPKGEAIFNAEFVPKFEAAFSAYQKTGKDPMQFLTRENVDKMIEGMRPRAQMAQDRLNATGETASGVQEAPNAPLPPAPAGLNAGEWTNLMSAPPTASTGNPFTHAAWAKVLQMLAENPEQGVKDFDAKFGPAGYSGAEILQRLKRPVRTLESGPLAIVPTP